MTKPDAGYSNTIKGTIGVDGVHRDLQGNEIPNGLNDDTRAELESMLAPRQVRVLPSESDLLLGKGGPTYVEPTDADSTAKVSKPGYAVTDAKSTGEVPGTDADKAAQEGPAKNG